jgi:hypothetical protein
LLSNFTYNPAEGSGLLLPELMPTWPETYSELLVTRNPAKMDKKKSFLIESRFAGNFGKVTKNLITYCIQM